MVKFSYQVTNGLLAFQLVELVEFVAQPESKHCLRSQLQGTDNPLGINTFKIKFVEFEV